MKSRRESLSSVHAPLPSAVDTGGEGPGRSVHQVLTQSKAVAPRSPGAPVFGTELLLRGHSVEASVLVRGDRPGPQHVGKRSLQLVRT